MTQKPKDDLEEEYCKKNNIKYFAKDICINYDVPFEYMGRIIKEERQQTAQEIFKEIDFLIENKDCIYKLSDKDYNKIKQKYLGAKE